MISNILQIVFLLGITALFVWIYYRIRLLGIESDKKKLGDNFSDLRIKYSSLLTRYAKVEDDMIKLKSETLETNRQRQSTDLQLQDLLLAQETYKVSLHHLESYKNKHDDLLIKLREAESRINTLYTELKPLERERIEIQAELNRRQTTIDSQRQSLNNLANTQNAYLQLQNEHSYLQNDLIILSGKVKQLNTEKQQLNERIKHDALQISSLQTALLSLESIKERYAQLLSVSEQYRTKATALTQELNEAQRTIKQLEDKFPEHEMQAVLQKQTKAVLDEVRAQYKTLMPQYQKLETEMHDLQDKINQMMSLPADF